jgi:hypothetical protein
MPVQFASTPRPRRLPRARRILGALGLALLLLNGCALRAPRPDAAHAGPALSDARARQLVGEWQRQLADYIDSAGDGDPAVLARLPSLRATGTLRPSRITFGALDLDASAAERDGFDVQGLLLGPLPGADTAPYVFVVGIVQRHGYRPVDIADVRLVSMTLRGDQLDWTVGDSDAQALARYRAGLDRSAPLRFPADKDRFDLAICAPRLCAEEALTAARWSLPALAQTLAATAR